MKTDAQILMYNFKENERTRQISRYLNIAGISCKTVPVTDYSQEQQTDFLGFFHRNGLAPVDLKAVLTPVTQHWSSLKLHGELSKEHTLMHKK